METPLKKRCADHEEEAPPRKVLRRSNDEDEEDNTDLNQWWRNISKPLQKSNEEEEETFDLNQSQNLPKLLKRSNEKEEQEEKTNDLNQWRNLPKGAAPIIRRIAAELILEKIIVGFQEKNKVLLNEEIYGLVKEFPVLAHRTYEMKYKQINDKGSEKIEECYLLAVVCYLQPPLKLVKAVYEANPEAIKQEELKEGGLPIHTACSWEGSMEVISFLHANYRPGVQIAEHRYGMLPLHLALAFKADERIVHFLLDEYPESAQRNDEDEYAPIHHACLAGGVSVQVISRLCDMNPRSIVQRENKGWTPFLLACQEPSTDPSVFTFLFEREPLFLTAPDALEGLFLAAQQQGLVNFCHLLERFHPANNDGPPPVDSDGATVLHLACQTNNIELVEYLIRRYPFMLTTFTTDAFGGLPIHYAAANNGNLATVKLLLEYQLNALSLENGQDDLPLRVAKQNNVTDELMDFLIEQFNKTGNAAEYLESSDDESGTEEDNGVEE